MKHIQVSRYGKFIPKKQENNYGNDTYHSAPAPFGFYCFDIRHIERFLVGHVYKKQDYYKSTIISGEIWIHHVPQKRNMILAEHNTWFLIDVRNYFKIVDKYAISDFVENHSKDHYEIFCTPQTKLGLSQHCYNKYKTLETIK